MEQTGKIKTGIGYFRATMAHNKDSYLALTKMQYLQYGSKFRLLLFELGAMFVVGGVLFEESFFTMLLLMIGCWLIVSGNYLPIIRAERLVRHAGGKYPKTEYCFRDEVLEYGNSIETGTLAYSDIIRITQDDDFCYLFIENKAAHVIPKAELRPNDFEQFEKFLFEKTGQVWYVKRADFLEKIIARREKREAKKAAKQRK